MKAQHICSTECVRTILRFSVAANRRRLRNSQAIRKSFGTGSKAGFSLIEILVVAAIIVVLAALIFPTLQASLQSAKQSKSIGNLRAISGALMSYVADQNGALPKGAVYPNGQASGAPRYWFNALDYYMGGTDYTAVGMSRASRPNWQNCPAKVFANQPVFQGNGVGIGYGWNHGYFGYTPDVSPQKLGYGSTMSQVGRLSQTIIVGTSIDDPGASDVLQHMLLYANTNIAATRFKGRGLYLFLDGHIEALTPQQATTNSNYLFLKTKP